MSPAGRRKLENAKKCRIEIRISRDEKEALEDIVSKRPGTTMSSVLRYGIWTCSLFNTFPELEEIINAIVIAQGRFSDIEIKENTLSLVKAETNSLIEKLQHMED